MQLVPVAKRLQHPSGPIAQDLCGHALFLVSLQCGQTSSENCTYLTVGATGNTLQANCVYTICPSNPNICRMRLDFMVYTNLGHYSAKVAIEGCGSNDMS